MKEDPNYCHYSGLPSPMAYEKQSANPLALHEVDIDRIIAMAWEDRTPFDAIRTQFGLTEEDVRKLMRASLKPSSYVRWRRRVERSRLKHSARRMAGITRFKAPGQKDWR